MAVEFPSALEALLTRRSVPALKLREPGPTSDQIAAAIDAALRAPDHGNLKPWRCVLIRGEARTRLSDLFVQRMQQRQPAPPPGKVEKARTMPLTAPLVIAVGARIRQDHKVPEVEQWLSCGAATMNLLDALHSQGYAAIWLTGPNAYDPDIARALGFTTDERCHGFVYVGTPPQPSEVAASRIDRAPFVRDWSG
jgi:nitroreductase